MKTLFPGIFFATLAVLAAGLPGCSPGDKFLSADVSVLEISAEDTSSRPVAVESSASWIVDTSGAPEWLSVRYDSNDQNLFWVAATINESLQPRSAEITVVSGDGLIIAIPLTQFAMDVRFEPSVSSLLPFGARDASTQTISVDTGLEWEAVQLHGDWITLARGTADEGTLNSLAVGVKSTHDIEERRDTIVLRPLNPEFESLADSLPVVQSGIDLVVSSTFMSDDTFEVDIPAEGAEAVLMVQSRFPWSVAAVPADKVTLSVTTGGIDMEYGTPLVVTVLPNTSSEEEYTFTLTFTSAGETYEYLCRQQKNSPPER